jgi:predicted transcriptional regulator
MNDNQDQFNVLRKINKRPEATQRELAEELEFSLGKLNYCLKALKNKGFIKMSSVGNWVIVFIVVVVWFIWSMNKG